MDDNSPRFTESVTASPATPAVAPSAEPPVELLAELDVSAAATASPPVLCLDNMTRLYPNGGGVVDLTLRLGRGEIHALIGANGAGKTTALSVLSGLRFAASGKMTLSGQNIPLDRAVGRLGMGSVADQPVLDRRLTPWQWLSFVASLRQLTILPLDSRAMAKTLRLTESNLSEPIAALSFGTQRKVALWAELLTTRCVLLLDEPLTGLDPLSIEGLHAALQQFVGQGRAVLLSTHLLREAEAVATHANILVDGRLVASGTMGDVRGQRSLREVFLSLAGEVV